VIARNRLNLLRRKPGQRGAVLLDPDMAHSVNLALQAGDLGRDLDLIVPVLEEALVSQPDAIAVTTRPGLIGALLVGVSAAKALAWARQRLEQLYGPVALASPAYDFNQTAYYEPTMGPDYRVLETLVHDFSCILFVFRQKRRNQSALEFCDSKNGASEPKVTV